MYLISLYKMRTIGNNLLLNGLRGNLKRLCSSSNTITINEGNITKTTENDEFIERFKTRILYNTVIENMKIKKGFHRNRARMLKLETIQERLDQKVQGLQPLPLSLRYITDEDDMHKKAETEEHEEESECDEKLTQFPFESTNKIESVPVNNETVNLEDRAKAMNEEVRARNELMKDAQNWMTGYDNYDDKHIQNEDNADEVSSSDWQINYGTPDPQSEISNVPCGGCGALLHCKDTSIPGYLPSEIYKNYRKVGGFSLHALICQRCYFLKNYNLALQLRVSPYDYPKVLKTIQTKRALVVLMVDLLDFPCSIWPGIADILGPKMPIVVVGNKVDLLPKDSTNYLTNIKRTLLDYVKLSGFGTANIQHVALISAKTGYGVESLITSLQTIWKHQGDVYLVGCTNVGKSSLFNTLLQSDYCKIQSVDLIQRATTSQWPGTTLNLLKFPIMRPSPQRSYLRHQRLKAIQKVETEEKRLRNEKLHNHNSVKNATLFGHIGQSYTKFREDDEKLDAFSVHTSLNTSGKVIMGIRERDPQYAMGRWCFDTPGVVQSDQITHLLTTEELLLTLPKELIRPETFCMKPGTSLFIAGLARMDYIEGPRSVRLTVFRSNELPITICKLEEADYVYRKFLKTDLLKVPVNDSNRLDKWPGLEMSKSFSLTGISWAESSKDIVLSSAGWIAVNCGVDEEYKFQAWTPEKRGCHVRDCLLPKAVSLRGRRIRFSPAYKRHKFI